jgi:hypothetical protein
MRWRAAVASNSGNEELVTKKQWRCPSEKESTEAKKKNLD